MNRYKFLSALFVVIGVVVIAAFLVGVASYVGGTLQAVVNFVTTNDFNKLKACGMAPVPQLTQLQYDLPTVILPMVYTGLPLLFFAVSLLMFIAGFYYHKGVDADEESKKRKAREEGVEDVRSEESKKRIARKKAEEDLRMREENESGKKRR